MCRDSVIATHSREAQGQGSRSQSRRNPGWVGASDLALIKPEGSMGAFLQEARTWLGLAPTLLLFLWLWVQAMQSA